eukprot:4016407-Amphidinium_carterae.1
MDCFQRALRASRHPEVEGEIEMLSTASMEIRGPDQVDETIDVRVDEEMDERVPVRRWSTDLECS